MRVGLRTRNPITAPLGGSQVRVRRSVRPETERPQRLAAGAVPPSTPVGSLRCARPSQRLGAHERIAEVVLVPVDELDESLLRLGRLTLEFRAPRPPGRASRRCRARRARRSPARRLAFPPPRPPRPARRRASAARPRPSAPRRRRRSSGQVHSPHRRRGFAQAPSRAVAARLSRGPPDRVPGIDEPAMRAAAASRWAAAAPTASASMRIHAEWRWLQN